MGFNCRAAHTRRAGIGVCCTGRIKVAIKRVVKATDDAVDIGDGCDLLNLIGRHDFGLKPHEAVLGPFGHQHIEPVLIFGQCDTTHVVQTAGHARDLLQLLVKLDSIALKGGHVGITIQRVKPTGRVPCGTRRQLRAFQ